MVLPLALCVHTVSLSSKKKSWSLAYDGGTAVFTAGKTLTGGTSHATATIISTGSAATGTLTLHTISGVFQNNDVLSDNNGVPGAAVADGVVFETVDAYGQPVTAGVTTSSIACRFVSPAKRYAGGLLLESSPRVLFPPTVTIGEGDTITSTNTGYAATFGIITVKYVYEAAQTTVSHVSCEIGAPV